MSLANQAHAASRPWIESEQWLWIVGFEPVWVEQRGLTVPFTNVFRKDYVAGTVPIMGHNDQAYPMLVFVNIGASRWNAVRFLDGGRGGGGGGGAGGAPPPRGNVVVKRISM
jgi:hypothetical protein